MNFAQTLQNPHKSLEFYTNGQNVYKHLGKYMYVIINAVTVSKKSLQNYLIWYREFKIQFNEHKSSMIKWRLTQSI